MFCFVSPKTGPQGIPLATLDLPELKDSIVQLFQILGRATRRHKLSREVTAPFFTKFGGFRTKIMGVAQ